MESKRELDERDYNIIVELANSNMNISEAAISLYMHRNTVCYHIRKIKALTGKDPMDFFDLYELVEFARERGKNGYKEKTK